MAAPFTWNVRVYYEDTDTAGVVYYANYLRFFERARSEWLRALGIDQRVMSGKLGLVFVVRRAALEFVAASRLDDMLRISVDILKMGRASVDLTQEASVEGRRVCTAKVTVACVRREDFKPVAFPENIRTRMKI